MTRCSEKGCIFPAAAEGGLCPHHERVFEEWTPHKRQSYEKWGGVIRDLLLLQDGESRALAVPRDCLPGKFQGNLRSILSTGKAVSLIRWELRSAEEGTVVIVTRVGFYPDAVAARSRESIEAEMRDKLSLPPATRHIPERIVESPRARAGRMGGKAKGANRRLRMAQANEAAKSQVPEIAAGAGWKGSPPASTHGRLMYDTGEPMMNLEPGMPLPPGRRVGDTIPVREFAAFASGKGSPRQAAPAEIHEQASLASLLESLQEKRTGLLAEIEKLDRAIDAVSLTMDLIRGV